MEEEEEEEEEEEGGQWQFQQIEDDGCGEIRGRLQNWRGGRK